jgi:hypothetical protein
MALRFPRSGGNDAVKSTAPFNHNAAYTVLMWLKDPTLVADYQHAFHVGVGESYVGNTDLFGVANNGQQLMFGTAGGTSDDFPGGMAYVAPSTTEFWVAMVRESATVLKFYWGTDDADGVLAYTSTSNVGSRAAANTMMIGGFSSLPFAGDIALPRMWTRALTLANLHAEVASSTVVDDTAIYSAPPFAGANLGVALTDASAGAHSFTDLSGGNVTVVTMLADSLPAGGGGGGDVTAPVLSAASAAAASATTATGSVTTDEAGPAWAVLTESATTPSATQIKAGQDHTGATTPSDTATLVIGSNPAAFAFSGLTSSTEYWIHIIQDDAASPANVATPITAGSSITTPTVDVTAPVLSSASATATSHSTASGSVTSTEAGPGFAVMTTNATTPTSTQIEAGQDHTGASAAAFDSATLASGANADVFSFTGLIAETGYYMHVGQKDTADTPNVATPVTAAQITTDAAPAEEEVSITALLFPGKYSDDANARMKLTGADMPSRFAMTATAQVYFNQHSSYYAFLAFQDDLGVETWSGGHYEYIACPYATTSGAVDANGLFTSTDGGAVHHFEIGGHTPLGSSTSEDRGAAAGDTAILVRKGVWLQMIMKTEVVNISGTDYEKHSLWPDVEMYPNKAIVGYKPLADFPTPTNPALMIGSHKWAPQNATYNDEPMDGRVRALRVIKGVLPLDKAKLELAAAVRGTGAWATTEASAFGGTILDSPTLANIGATPWTWDNADRPTDYSGTIMVPGGPDTTAPALSSPTATATGPTTASGTVTTDEGNGTLYFLMSTNATELAATVKAAGSQAVSGTGVQNVTFTGLTASTNYYAHYVHTDAATNDSTRVSSAQITTPTPDTTAPVLTSPTATAKSNALIEATVTTDEGNGTLFVVATTSATPPSSAQVIAGTDHADAPAVFSTSVAVGSTGVKTTNVTGLTELTLYYVYSVHRDAASNVSNVASASATSFRDGATGQYILDNTGPVGSDPAGILYNDVETGDEDKWFSFVITTPPATGTLDINADGTFTFTGPSPETMYYQLEVDGVNVGSPVLVNLYTADTTAPVLTSPTATATSDTTASGAVTTDEGNGTLYFLVSTNATELAATVKAAGSQAVSGTGVQNVTFTGLTASTNYYAHYVHTDAAANDSTRVSSAQITTSAAPDVTAPVLTSPTALATGPTTASGTVTTDEGNGTLHFLLSTNATELAATVKAAGSQAVSGTGVQNVTFTGLTASTNYYAHYVHTDAATNDSTRVSSAQITTSAAPDVTAPVLTSPTALATGPTTASGTVSTDEDNGTLYFLMSTNATELAATVKAADSQAVSGIGVQNVTFTGLTASTNYYAHYIHTDAAANDSTRVSSAQITTSAASDVTAPVLSSPTTAPAGATAVSGTVSTDEGNGTLYWVTTTNATELLATIKAGSSKPVTAVGVQTTYTPGRTPETAYYNHYAHTDVAGNDSNVVSSAQVTTPAVPAGSSVGARGVHISINIGL